MGHDVFISYSSKDKTVADAICTFLEGAHIRCWIAPRDILPGVPYGEAILAAIEEASVFVLVFSSSSNNSQQVLREVERAVSKSIAILPFRIQDIAPNKSLEYYISLPQWLDALTQPLETHINNLVNAVRATLDTRTDYKVLHEAHNDDQYVDNKQPTSHKKETEHIKPVVRMFDIIFWPLFNFFVFLPMFMVLMVLVVKIKRAKDQQSADRLCRLLRDLGIAGSIIGAIVYTTLLMMMQNA